MIARTRIEPFAEMFKGWNVRDAWPSCDSPPCPRRRVSVRAGAVWRSAVYYSTLSVVMCDPVCARWRGVDALTGPPGLAAQCVRSRANFATWWTTHAAVTKYTHTHTHTHSSRPTRDWTRERARARDSRPSFWTPLFCSPFSPICSSALRPSTLSPSPPASSALPRALLAVWLPVPWPVAPLPVSVARTSGGRT